MNENTAVGRQLWENYFWRFQQSFRAMHLTITTPMLDEKDNDLTIKWGYYSNDQKTSEKWHKITNFTATHQIWLFVSLCYLINSSISFISFLTSRYNIILNVCKWQRNHAASKQRLLEMFQSLKKNFKKKNSERGRLISQG